MYPLHIPTFTDKDLEWMNNQPDFYILLETDVKNKHNFDERIQIMAKYCIDSNRNRIFYPIKSFIDRVKFDGKRLYAKDEALLKDFIWRANACGLHQIGQNPLDLGGVCEDAKKFIVFVVDDLIHGKDLSIIGYCKQFDCNIGLYPEGKWMFDDRVYVLPKSVTEPTYENLESGQRIGSEHNECGFKDNIPCIAITKFPYKTLSYVYKKFE